MEQKKLLGQFAAKIAKSKMVYDSTKDYVERLNREAVKLEREYEELLQQRKNAESVETNLNSNYQTLKKQNDQESHKYSQEVERLSNLRDQKKRLKKEKDVADHDLLKNTLRLEQLVKQRQGLQSQAKQLSVRLQGITSEKQILGEQCQKTNQAIEAYSSKIRGLKTEIQNIKGVVAASTQYQ